LRVGGYYVLAGNAVGEIRHCDPPREIAVTWVYCEFESKLGLRLSPVDGRTLLEIVHGPIPTEMIVNPTPELWGLAVNWEMVLAGLAEYLGGRSPEGAAINWMARMSTEARAASMARANELNTAWVALLELAP
jgi:hypothetical protein